MLLRLRQLCFHPALITEGFDALLVGAVDIKSHGEEIDRAVALLGQDFVDKIKAQRLQHTLMMIKAEQDGVDVDASAGGDDEYVFYILPFPVAVENLRQIFSLLDALFASSALPKAKRRA